MNLIKLIVSFVGSCWQKLTNTALFALAAFFAFFAASPAQAQIDLSGFTDSLDDVEAAVTTNLGSVVTAALAVAGVILGGFILWRIFKRLIKA